MILHVAFEQFTETVARILKTKDVFLVERNGLTAVTAGDPTLRAVVASLVREPRGAVQSKLTEQGYTVADGEWTDAGSTAFDSQPDRIVYVAAVAFNSREKTPGLWMDAYPAPPAQGLVLRTFYDELVANGEIGEVSFEEFVRMADPNVVILGPNEIQSFLNDKEGC